MFYTRRLEVPAGFLAESWVHGSDESAGLVKSFTPVDEYVPDYSVGGVSYGNDYSDTRTAHTASVAGGGGDDDKAQRFLVEVQRSLDLWDRSWSSMPLNGVRVYAGERSEELSKWLGAQLGQTVLPLDVNALFPGFEDGSLGDKALCLPLLGVVMRAESRKL